VSPFNPLNPRPSFPPSSRAGVDGTSASYGDCTTTTNAADCAPNSGHRDVDDPCVLAALHGVVNGMHIASQISNATGLDSRAVCLTLGQWAWGGLVCGDINYAPCGDARVLSRRGLDDHAVVTMNREETWLRGDSAVYFRVLRHWSIGEARGDILFIWLGAAINRVWWCGCDLQRVGLAIYKLFWAGCN
jgi:hypothetical protein